MEDKKNYPLQNSAFRNGGKDYPNLRLRPSPTHPCNCCTKWAPGKPVTSVPKALCAQWSFRSQLLKSNLDTNEYHMNPISNIIHDSQFWKPSVSGYVAAKVTLVDSVTWKTQNQPGQAAEVEANACDLDFSPFEYHSQSRESGHLIVQSHDLESSRCTFALVFQLQCIRCILWKVRTFLRVLCSVCPPRKAPSASKMWASDISQLLKDLPTWY